MAGCPNDETMAAFSEGRLSERETTLLHEHIDGCQSCQWLLRELAAKDEQPTVAGKPSSPPVLAPGALLAGRYRLERMLGNGGMGTVWAALHVGTDRPIALKVLRAEKGTAARLRFLREARVLGRIDHPNLVPVRDVFEEGGVPILAMDLLTGESLGDRLRREGRIPLAQLAPLVCGAMEAVKFAHASGIVHRDLKPDNLFVTGGEVMRVLDFGIAKLISGEEPMTLTAAGEVLGTPPYMAPEQLRGEAAIDGRVDVWAFGVILYECLCGRRPFTGDRFAQIFDRVTAGKREPLVAPDVPRDVVALVEKMLQVDAGRRPTLDEAIAVLRRPREEQPPARRAWMLLPILLVLGLVGSRLLSPAPKSEPAMVIAPTPEPTPTPSPSPTPSASSCAWSEPRVCEVPALAMRAAAYRTGLELEGAGEGERGKLEEALRGCDGEEACLLKQLQGATPRISVIDCGHAVSLDARTICQSLPLAQLAGSLAAHYQADREHYARSHRRLQRLPGGRFAVADERGRARPGSVPAPTAFSADQTTWLIARHGCGEDAACLTRLFEERIAALHAIHRVFLGE